MSKDSILSDPTKLMTLQEFMEWVPPDVQPLISGDILYPETNMIMFGAAKTWKSSIAYNMAKSLVTGTEWIGHRTQQCVVFFVQAEMPLGVQRKRLGKAYSDYYTDALFKSSKFYMKFDKTIKIDTTYGQQKLAKDLAEIRKQHPKEQMVVVLDPLYKMMTGKISDEYDMRKFTSGIEELAAKFRFACVLIHHKRLTRVDNAGQIVDLGAEEMLGSSILNDWCDTAIGVRIPDSADPDIITMSFPLTRHAEEIQHPMKIKIERSTLSISEVEEELELENLR